MKSSASESKSARYQRILTFRRPIIGSFSSFSSFRRIGEIKKIKCLGATAFSSDNNK